MNGTGTIDGNSGSPVLTFGASNAGGAYSGAIQNSAGTLALVKLGSGMETLSGANTYSGSTTVSGGTLKFYDTAPIPRRRLPSLPAPVLEFNVNTIPNGGDTPPTNVNLGAAGGTTITGSGIFRKSGPGILGLDGQNPGGHPVTFNLTGGTIDIQGGTLRNGGWGGGIWTNNLASMNVAAGAMFDFWGGQSMTVDALNGSGTIDSTKYGASQTLTVGVNNGSGTFSGIFQNSTGDSG